MGREKKEKNGLSGDLVIGQGYSERGFFKKLVSMIAIPASAAAIKKLDEKLPVFSARIPATDGPVI